MELWMREEEENAGMMESRWERKRRGDGTLATQVIDYL